MASRTCSTSSVQSSLDVEDSAIKMNSRLLLAVVFILCHRGYTSPDQGDKLSDSFAVNVHGGPDVAEDVAKAYGLRSLGKIGNLQELYLFKLENNKYTKTTASNYTFPLKMEKRLKNDRRVGFVLRQKLLQRAKRYSPPTDPSWTRQWSLLNTGQVGGSPGRDLNVEPVWMQGITGRGIVVAVVDDGILYEHPDLTANFDRNGSYDYVDNDKDVSPGYTRGKRDSHGTSCAGEIVMAKDNKVCGVGVAYEAKIAGLRLVSQFTTDAAEASALGHMTDYIDIYTNSWGPFDNGILVEGPGPLLKAVLKNGVKKGRGGKGSIFVWASGNGGHKSDSCATDGYASSVYTIAVGAADQYGTPAYFDEICTSKMAVTFSHNTETLKRNQIITTNADGTCRDDFVGTSASCPLVSGVIALALQANPTLTWRDVQYLIVYTSKYLPLRSRSYWNRNGAGFWISKKFGFGAIDAEALVSRARNWINIPERKVYTFQPQPPFRNVTIEQPLVINFQVGMTGNPVRFLEHITVEVTLSLGGYAQRYSYDDFISISNYLGVFFTQDDLDELIHHTDARRGDISITLMSPQGTRSELLPYRDRDFVNTEGFDAWPFMSVLHWNEAPQGLWSLTISYRSQSGHVHLSNVSITFYGTESKPAALSMIPEQCDPACRGKCAAPGPEFCDTCSGHRNAYTLECVANCTGGWQALHRYCINPLANTSYSYRPASFPIIEATPASIHKLSSDSANLRQEQTLSQRQTYVIHTSAHVVMETPSVTIQRKPGLSLTTTMPIQSFSLSSLDQPACNTLWFLSTYLPRPTTIPLSSGDEYSPKPSAVPVYIVCSGTPKLPIGVPSCGILSISILHIMYSYLCNYVN